jgi:DNA polymerase elongation subunit (family B)
MNNVLKTEDDYIIAIDTDSIYVHAEDALNAIVDTMYDPGEAEPTMDQKVKALDLFAKRKIEPALQASFEELRAMLNCREQKMVMGREKIARRMLFVAKKKYMAHVIDDEGVRYAEPKLKITGIQAVQSSTPMFCRALIKEGLELIMTKDEATIQKFIAAHKAEFLALRPDEVAFPRGVHNMGKYTDGDTYTKGSPIHVRGSILYNAYLKELGIKNKYEPIRDDDKIKFCYLKMPNPIQENVIAFPVILPPEFELEKYIDYELQYQKTFVEPMKLILTAIGWSTERRSTLENFFG